MCASMLYTGDNGPLGVKPDFIKSCSYCKLKKVKCSGEVPTCSRCSKSNVVCNIVEGVGYTYKTVQSLLTRISELEDQLSRSQPIDTQIPTFIDSQQQQQQSQQQLSQSQQQQQSQDPQQQSQPNTTNDKVIDGLSTEVGSLTIGTNLDEGKYIGAATGSNFARVFLKQINLNHLENIDSLNDDFELFDASVTRTCAALPNYRISKYLLFTYIDKIQIYYPVFNIPNLRFTFELIYQDSDRVSYFDKFLIFMVLAIGSLQTTNDYKAGFYNPFKAVEYYNTALRYFDSILSRRSEKSLQALIVIIIWMLESNALQDDGGDLWHMSRFCMSLAMELGVHRFNPDWNFGEPRNETRNRLFWSTYIIDRTVAMKFGRGLSLRNQAIDTPLPKLSNDDYLVPDDGIDLLTNYNQVHFLPCIMLTKICRIGGDMLESIYISRTVGAAPILSDEKIIEMKQTQQSELNEWMVLVDREIPKQLTCYYELKARFNVSSIILNRPSPSFPIPDTESILLCKSNCIECVNCYNQLLSRGWRITPTCLHDMVNTGLTMIYCSWRLDTDTQQVELFSNDILKIMEEACRVFPKFKKFRQLFCLVSTAIVEHIKNMQQQEHQQQHHLQQLQQQQFHHQQQQVFAKDVPSNVMTSNPNEPQQPTGGIEVNGMILEWNDLFSQEGFQSGFKNYFDMGNDRLLNDLSEHFSEFSSTHPERQ